jgi:tetratricopeptide (TPR) repeat protein
MSKAKWALVSVAAAVVLILACIFSFNAYVRFVDAGKTPEQIAIEDELVEARARYWKNPNDVKAIVPFGIALRKCGDLEYSVKCLNQAVSADPKCFDAYLERGITHYLSGKFDDAEKDYQTAIEIDSRNGDVYGWFGNVETARAKDSQKAKDLEKCMEHLDKAIDLQKKCRQYKKNKLMWRTNLGDTEITAGNFAKAAGRTEKEVRERLLSGCKHLEEGLDVGPIGEWNERTPPAERPFKTEYAVRVCKLLIETYADLGEKQKAAAAKKRLKELESRERSGSGSAP